MRELGIPTVTDRLIQQALLQVLQSRIDPTFSAYSYGYRIVVDVDLEKFFDRVHHAVCDLNWTYKTGQSCDGTGATVQRESAVGPCGW